MTSVPLFLTTNAEARRRALEPARLVAARPEVARRAAARPPQVTSLDNEPTPLRQVPAPLPLPAKAHPAVRERYRLPSGAAAAARDGEPVPLPQLAKPELVTVARFLVREHRLPRPAANGAVARTAPTAVEDVQHTPPFRREAAAGRLAPIGPDGGRVLPTTDGQRPTTAVAQPPVVVLVFTADVVHSRGSRTPLAVRLLVAVEAGVGPAAARVEPPTAARPVRSDRRRLRRHQGGPPDGAAS